MLKAPVKYDDLVLEYNKDSDLDYERLDVEELKISSLVAKYAAILSYHRRLVFSLDEKYREMREKRTAYYRGEFCYEDLQKEGWDQYQGNKITLSSLMKETLDNDGILIPILLKRQLNQDIVSFCEIILKELNSRGYNIRAAIEFRKYLKGIN